VNPVRASMVQHPSEYPWSNYGSNALGREDALVSAHDEYRRLGTTAEQRHLRIVNYFVRGYRKRP